MRARLMLAGILPFLLFAEPAAAQNDRRQTPQLPVLMTADEVTYDEDLGIATATGNVEISQNDRVLRADTVSFNQRSNMVTASGNVSLLEPTGDVIFADYVELSQDFRDGTIQNFRALLADQSRLAAVSGRRSGGNLTAARKAVYSPCELCAKDPTRPPIWQIKAARVTHDQAEKEIVYNDAWIELAGVPVLYTPYLSHPDGTVPRSSGLLAPVYTQSNRIGTLISVPYYQILGPSSDITFEPIYVSQDNPVAAAEYRERTAKGQFQLSGSLTSADRRNNDNNRTSGTQTRGHIKGAGRFDVDDDWRWGFDVARSTDDNYIARYKLQQRYGFLDSNTLTSRLYSEGFRDRSYAAVNSYAFQGLRPSDKPGLAPAVLPMLDYNYVGEPGRYGGYYSFDANALSIYRSEGTRTQRVVSRGGWTIPYTADSGEIYSFSTTLLGEGYSVSNLGSLDDPNRPSRDGRSGRVFPQLNLGWRYP
ncbi:MAG: LPS-assembly protein LptD, partial [Rhodospirillales bacterium]|nr:LPS-assembly protein LptD [Rhodospirillales bacterium]